MPAIDPTNHFLKYPKNEIGSYALDLSNLASLNIPLPTTYCVPVSTFKLIAQHNHLDEKFLEIVQNTNHGSSDELLKAVERVQKLILSQAYPNQVSQKLLDLYQRFFDQDYIRLTASPVDGYPLDYKREDNIKGEANMMESILKLWARNIDPSDIKRNNLFPVAVIIQSQFQPTSSGLAYSLNLKTGDKSHFTIQAVYGVFSSSKSLINCDHFFVDRRDWQVVAQEISKKKKANIRSPDLLKQKNVSISEQKKPSLTNDQVRILAKIVNSIKLQFTHQVLVHWELVDNDILITKIKPYYFSKDSDTKVDSLKTIAIGQSLTPGYIVGPCQLIKNKKDIKSIKPGYIGVVKELDNDYLKLVHTCSAIICEQNVKSNLILNKIRYYQLPTIINAQGALSTIKDSQLITVDSSAGKVYSQQKIERKRTIKTKLQLLISINDNTEINNNSNCVVNGVGIIRSEHFFIKTGKHPQLIINSERQQFLDQVVNKITTLYHRLYSLNRQIPVITYRSCNLDTNQLARLESGDIYEQLETNPFIGFRGAARAINKPSVFNLELDILNKVNSKLDFPVNLMLPFVRNAFELKQLWNILENKFDSPVNQPPLWLQLNTPENLLNIKDYLSVPLSAICINIKTVHALLHGVDPYSIDLYNRYSVNHDLLLPTVNNLLNIINQHDHNIDVYFILSDFDQQLIEFANLHNLKGIIAPEKLLTQISKFFED